MSAPRVFHYHPSTGAYLGTALADPSPREPGVWLVPAYSTEVPPPSPGEGQGAFWRNGEWVLETLTTGPAPTPVPLAQAKAAKLAALALRRFAVETGGTTFNGQTIRTDRETSAILTAAYVKAVNNPDYVVNNWKVADGVFVTLDAPAIFALSDAVSDHVQASFDREAELSAAILAATTLEALDAIDIHSGW